MSVPRDEGIRGRAVEDNSDPPPINEINAKSSVLKSIGVGRSSSEFEAATIESQVDITLVDLNDCQKD